MRHDGAVPRWTALFDDGESVQFFALNFGEKAVYFPAGEW